MKFLDTEDAQEVIAKHYYRPTSESIKKKTADRFPPLKMFEVTSLAPTWDAVQKKFFANDAMFDQIFAEGRKK